MTTRIQNRWLVVFGSLLMQLGLGALYTWSLFNAPLIAQYGWNQGATVFTFSVTLATFSLTVIIAGKIQDKIGPRKVATVGGLLTGFGVATASLATTPIMLYITYGVIAGLGIGATYVTPLATCSKWFPEKRGIITGLVLAALGFGGMLFKPIILFFIDSYGVSTAFLYLGLIYGTLIVIGAQFLVVPPAGYKPRGWEPQSVADKDSTTSYNYSFSEALKTPQLYIVFMWMFFNSMAGLMLISVAADIGMQVLGLSLTIAGNAVVAVSVFNGVGKIVWGGLLDKLRYKKAIMSLNFLLFVAMLYMSLFPMTYSTFLLATCVVGFCFGGFGSVLPTVTAEWFGTANVGNNYGAVFLFYGIAALIAPKLVVHLGFELAFILSAIACAIATVLTFYTKPPTHHNVTNKQIVINR